MNDFEQFIKANKDKMTIKDVNPEIWQNIEARMSQTEMSQAHSKRVGFKILPFAASVFAVVLLVSLMKSSPTEKGFDNLLISEINNKVKSLQSMSFPAQYKADLTQLVKQVQYLDKQALPNINYLKTVNQEAYIEKLVMQYYQSKSDLLDKLMHEIKRINQLENTYTTNENNHENTTLSI